jgi:excisionase family DNA binding protein
VSNDVKGEAMSWSDKRFLDVKEVSKEYGLAVSTLYTMVSQRRIPYTKMGRCTKFDRVELERWIAGHSVKVRRSLATSAP